MCVRFQGHDGNRKVLCGVTAEALKRCDPNLPHTGLIPAEEFLKAFERLLSQVHGAARLKHAKGQFERQGDIEVLVKRHDLLKRRPSDTLSV
jgi:hypothetical protein